MESQLLLTFSEILHIINTEYKLTQKQCTALVPIRALLFCVAGYFLSKMLLHHALKNIDLYALTADKTTDKIQNNRSGFCL